MKISQTIGLVIGTLSLIFLVHFFTLNHSDHGDNPKSVPTVLTTVATSPESENCDDPEWCNVPMPQRSYFRFSPPDNLERWKAARLKAAKGEQVLLNRVIKYFPNTQDFLDGDIFFRQYHLPIDYYIDDNRHFDVLTNEYWKDLKPLPKRPRKVKYSWEKPGNASVIPGLYDFREIQRAPVLRLGYFAFAKYFLLNNYFSAGMIGEASIGRKKFMKLWKEQADKIDRPFVLLHSANENWGLLSTYFPNRTANWGKCCSEIDDKLLFEFLNHNKTILFLINQHSNITHPKLVTLPRGIPLHFTHTRKLLWDIMYLLSKKKKRDMLFVSSSTWGYRPNIVSCISKKFGNTNHIFSAKYDESQKGRMPPHVYYNRLGLSKFGLALPGLGYDTYRLWESMTIGTIPIIEKGVGFDKSLWRLPALIVEDFDEVGPEMLKEAYIESIYRAEEFEFERLTQSFWWSFIANVSAAQSSEKILEKFPLEAEDPNFARPFKPYNCENGCGPGTRRPPKSMC